MSLTNLDFDAEYDSYETDIIDKFYVPALSNASNYDRVSAYFDSKILSFYSKGIKSIAKQEGKIRFIFSHQLNEQDYELMEKGYTERALNEIVDNFSEDNLTEEDLIRLSDLSYLISRGVADVKIAFTKLGLNHDKFGLIYDQNDCIYFRGSNNETLAAVFKNHEQFEVSCTMWHEDHEDKKIQKARKTFEKIWNNEVIGRNVVEIPDVIKEKLELIESKYGYNEDIQNSIVLDFVNGSLVMINNLLEVDINKDFTYKNYIKSHIKSIENNKYIFQTESYAQINRRIEQFTKITSKYGAELIITNRLDAYLADAKDRLLAKVNIGTAIKTDNFSFVKNYEDDLTKWFNTFNAIINRDMERKLRYKQVLDAFHIACIESAANFSVPGAGKTSIVYGAYAYLSSKEKNKVNKIVMVGPLSSFKSWKDEFVANFGDKKELRVLDIHDKKYNNKKRREDALKADSGHCNLILINYESLDALQDALKEIINSKTMLVFDEIHKIKAIGGVAATAALNISENAKFKVALTGTPIPNSYLDLCNMLDIILGKNRQDYVRYTVAELKNPTPMKVKEINEKIFPFFCRTTKTELGIPLANDDNLVTCHPSQIENKLYQIISKKYSGCSLEKYIRLLQASTNPKLLLNKLNKNIISDFVNFEDITEFKENYKDYNPVDISFDEEEISLINSINKSTKFKEGIELVTDLVEDYKQVLVWGIFVDTLNKISEELTELGIENSVICGSVDIQDREEIIENFKSKKIKVLIANPHTMAESVSLHMTCHDAVYFEYSFNLTHMLQSRDRINRLGLTEDQYTQYYYMMLESDDYLLDNRTYLRLKEKEKVMLDSIENKDLELISFSVDDDMKAIFADANN